MIAVIVAGGSGTRLWPLSTPDYPKHLLKINGSDHSLLQFTYARAASLGNEVYVLTEKSHAHHVREQLPEVDDAHFISEPARRGTANCITAALVQLSKNSIPADEPIAFMAADHYVRDTYGFKHSFELAGSASKASGRIVLVGIEPDFPATGFGYIKKGEVFDKAQLIYSVDGFKEKPDFKTAQTYQKSGGYLWNCCYFIGSLNTFQQSMRDYAPELLKTFNLLEGVAPEQYVQAYLDLQNEAIEYALIEKTKNLLVVPASFDWMDLGSFNDLHKATDSDEHGNHVTGKNVELEEVENSFVHDELGTPVAVIGLDNVAVINTKQGLLVARKDMSQAVGLISKRIGQK